jgi:hypothetical protein
MSPTAILVSSDDISISAPAPTVSAKGPALAIGSLNTAQDGKYQALISGLEGTRKVDRLLFDRLTDGGMYLAFGAPGTDV